MKKLVLAALASLSVAAQASEAPAGAPNAFTPLIMLGVFVVIFYLMVWRPQSKRQKEQKELMSNLSKGDEVVTTGGICGKIVKVTDEFVKVEVDGKVELTFQKPSIHATLPKGTLKSL